MQADDELQKVLRSAARLQEIVPDAVLVGGTAAALYAGQWESSDHDHFLSDLSERFALVLESLEATSGWVTNRVVPRKLILGELGDIEAGVRQLRRLVPLEVTTVTLPSGESLRVPTLEETLRVKAYLLVDRNQTRDYLDVVALAERMGVEAAARALAAIDEYYSDQFEGGTGVASQLVRQLSEPSPADARTVSELISYKGLAAKWHDWATVSAAARTLAKVMVTLDQAR